MRTRAFWLLTPLLLGGAAAHAQQPTATSAASLLQAARAQIDDLDADSAVVLLRRALDQRSGATPAQRVKGWVLFGIAELMSTRQPGARQAFREALRLDPALTIDSLADLHSDLLPVFAAEAALVRQARAGVVVPLSLVMEVAADTMLAPDSAIVRILATASRTATVVMTASDSFGTVVWRDSQPVTGSRAFSWPLAQLASGSASRLRLIAYALDSAGQRANAPPRLLVVEREIVDTTAEPQPLSRSAIRNELVAVPRGPTSKLIIAVGFAGAAVVTPMVLSNGKIGGGSGAAPFVAAAAISAAGVVGYLRGHHLRRDPSIVRANQEARDQNQRARQSVREANAARRRTARVRVHVEEVR